MLDDKMPLAIGNGMRNIIYICIAEFMTRERKREGQRECAKFDWVHIYVYMTNFLPLVWRPLRRTMCVSVAGASTWNGGSEDDRNMDSPKAKPNQYTTRIKAKGNGALSGVDCGVDCFACSTHSRIHINNYNI